MPKLFDYLYFYNLKKPCPSLRDWTTSSLTTAEHWNHLSGGPWKQQDYIQTDYLSSRELQCSLTQRATLSFQLFLTRFWRCHCSVPWQSRHISSAIRDLLHRILLSHKKNSLLILWRFRPKTLRTWHVTSHAERESKLHYFQQKLKALK